MNPNNTDIGVYYDVKGKISNRLKIRVRRQPVSNLLEIQNDTEDENVIQDLDEVKE